MPRFTASRQSHLNLWSHNHASLLSLGRGVGSEMGLSPEESIVQVLRFNPHVARALDGFTPVEIEAALWSHFNGLSLDCTTRAPVRQAEAA